MTTTTTPTEFGADKEIVGKLWEHAREHLADPEALDEGTTEEKVRAIDIVIVRAREQQERYGEIPRALADLIDEYRTVRARARPKLARSFRAKSGPTRFDRAAFELAEHLDASAVSKMSRETAAVLDRFLTGTPCRDLHDAIDAAAEAFTDAMESEHTRLPRPVAEELVAAVRRGPVVPDRRIGPGDSNITRGPRSYDQGRITVPASGPGAIGGAR